VWNFQSQGGKSKPFSWNLEYLQGAVKACREMISSETLEDLMQSLPYQVKYVIKAKG
jgi:hypothetical protein